MKINAGFYLSGVNKVSITDRGTPDNVTFIRESVVEQREAELLKQLEVSEDTVDVLEQLLQKYGAEILRLRAYNDALRKLSTPIPAPAPMPVINPVNAPSWTWPNQQNPVFPWNDMNKIMCSAEGVSRQEFFDFLSNASKIVDSWPNWKKAGLQGMIGEL